MCLCSSLVVAWSWCFSSWWLSATGENVGNGWCANFTIEDGWHAGRPFVLITQGYYIAQCGVWDVKGWTWKSSRPLSVWHYLALWFLLILKDVYYLRKLRVVVVPVVAGHPMVSCSLNFDLLWLPVMVSFFCEKKFLWWWVRSTLICEYKVSTYNVIRNHSGLGNWW